MTVLDLVTKSLKLLGVVAAGENPSAEASNDALASLNNLLDSWSTNRLFVYTTIREVFSLVASQQTYAMGPGGDFDTVRPQKIVDALIIPNGTNPQIELAMKILTQAEFASIVVKSVPSTIPLYIYNDNGNPSANINFWPVPSENVQVAFYSWKPIADFSQLSSEIVLPPGYLRALQYNLAIEIAPEYGISPTEAVLAIAIESLGNIKRMNSQPMIMSVDEALTSRNKTWNWLKGDTV